MKIAELFVRLTVDPGGFKQEMAGAERSLDSFGAATGRGKLSVGRLGNQFSSLASQIAGVHPVVGNLASVLSNFAVGGLVTVGVLGGVAAMALAWDHFTKASREAKKVSDDLTKSLLDQAKAQYQATFWGAQRVAEAAGENLAKVKGESGRGWRSIISLAVTGRDDPTDVQNQANRVQDAAGAVTQAWAKVGKIVEAANKPLKETPGHIAKVVAKYDELRDAAAKANAEILKDTTDWWKGLIDKTWEAERATRELADALKSTLEIPEFKMPTISVPTEADIKKAVGQSSGFFGGMKAGFRPKDTTETRSASLGEEVGQMINQASGGMAQAFADFGPMAAILPVINGMLEKLGPAFFKLIEPLVELGGAIGEILAPVFEMLVPIIKLVVAQLKVTLIPVIKAVVWTLSWLMQGIGLVVKAFGWLVDKINIFGGDGGIGKIGQEMIDAAKAARRNTDATDEATDAVSKFAGALSNIPRVLNINALRHMVTGGGGGGGGGGGDDIFPGSRLPGGGGGRGAGPATYSNYGDTYITVPGAGDPRQVAEEVGRVIERTSSRGGTHRLQVAFA